MTLSQISPLSAVLTGAIGFDVYSQLKVDASDSGPWLKAARATRHALSSRAEASSAGPHYHAFQSECDGHKLAHRRPLLGHV